MALSGQRSPEGFALGVIFLALFSAKASAALPWIKVDQGTKQFVSDDGSTFIFHGVNAVEKVHPYIPMTDSFDATDSLADDDLQNLADWGFNIVRLGVMWPGVEPTRGNYNETYLDSIRTLIKRMGDYGIYTLVDCHQDVLHPRYCGEGVPDYAVQPDEGKLKFPRPAMFHDIAVDPATGLPDVNACLENSFFKYYFASEVGSAYQAIYDNKDGLADSFAAYWKKVADAFKDMPEVIGYDLWNEPWPGDIYKNPLYLVHPGRADRELLVPLYTKMHDAIREVDTKHIVFFEGFQTDEIFSVGFEEPIGGDTYKDRTALSYHVYCPLISEEGDPTNRQLCTAYESSKFAKRVADSKNLGIGAMLTEFGAETPSTKGIRDLNVLGDLADQHLQSWAYWQFKFFHDITTQSKEVEGFYNEDSSLQLDKVKSLSRTYPQRTAGKLLSTAFDGTTGSFKMSYEPAAQGSTLVFANDDLVYPRGKSVVASGVVCDTSSHSRVECEKDSSLNQAVANVVIYGKRDIPTQGFLRNNDEDSVPYLYEPREGSMNFSVKFTLGGNLKWWKMVKIVGDDGSTTCQLELQDDTRESACEIDGANHVFGYKIELWKAKVLGIHTHVDTVDSQVLVPLLKEPCLSAGIRIE